MHALPYASVADRLKARGIEAGRDFWTAVHGNLSVLADAESWSKIISGELRPRIEDEELTARAASLLPEEPWDETTWDVWIAAIKAATGRKGKGLFMPLRKALTGRSDGPDMAEVMPLLQAEPRGI